MLFCSYFLEEVNVSAAVANNETNIFLVITHSNVMLWNLLWATASDIVFYLRKCWIFGMFCSVYEKYGKMHFFMTSQLPLWETNQFTIHRILILRHSCEWMLPFCDILKNLFKQGTIWLKLYLVFSNVYNINVIMFEQNELQLITFSKESFE